MLKLIRNGIKIYTTYQACNAIKAKLMGNKNTSVLTTFKKISKLFN